MSHLTNVSQYSLKKSEHKAGQQAHGNIYNTPGECGLLCHLIKGFAGTFQVEEQESQNRVLTKEKEKERYRSYRTIL